MIDRIKCRCDAAPVVVTRRVDLLDGSRWPREVADEYHCCFEICAIFRSAEHNSSCSIKSPSALLLPSSAADVGPPRLFYQGSPAASKPADQSQHGAKALALNQPCILLQGWVAGSETPPLGPQRPLRFV